MLRGRAIFYCTAQSEKEAIDQFEETLVEDGYTLDEWCADKGASYEDVTAKTGS
jgi:hypothetical protein